MRFKGSDDFVVGVPHLCFGDARCKLNVPLSRELSHPFEVFESQIVIGLKNAFDDFVGIGLQESRVALHLLEYAGEKPGLNFLEIRLAR
jgi:hypothetical protein